MDIFSTGALNRVVDSLKRPQAFLLNTFFGMIDTSETEEIFFDVELQGEKRRLAPFVSPLVEGKLVEGIGYETKSFKPAYIKDKRVHDATRPFKRMAGENIGTGQQLSPQQRRELAIRRDLADQADMLTRRLEVMASEVLRTGQETITYLDRNDDVEKQVVVNFGRDGNLTINLTAGSLWTDAGVKPLTDLEDWSMEVLQRSGASVRNIVMDPDAWSAFRDNAQLEKRLDLRRVQSGQINLGLIPENVQYKGNDGTFDYWVYADWYLDPATETEVPMLPSGTVLGVGDIMGVRHFGAIKDEEAGFQAREMFSKSWVVPDPSRRILLMQSAPLVVPYRVNAGFAANVLGN